MTDRGYPHQFLHTSIIASQTHVNGTVRCRAYKGMFAVLGRSSETEKLYDMYVPLDSSSLYNVSDLLLHSSPLLPGLPSSLEIQPLKERMLTRKS